VDEQQAFFEDDGDDTLLFKKLQEHVLETHPNPERIGCIDHSTLEAWVYSPEKLDLSDPKYLHVLKCAECTRELIELRKRRNEDRERVRVPAARQKTQAPRSWRWAGIAAILLCCLAIAGLAYWRMHSARLTPQTASAIPVAETIDLSQAGTVRGGETSAVPPVSLPRRVIAAHILLPNFSPGGKYVVSVTPDRNGSPAKAEALGTADVNGFHADLNVTLDLRNLGEGTYYLATTHDGDAASYFYPLTLQ
jgi:hypothetical protein